MAFSPTWSGCVKNHNFSIIRKRELDLISSKFSIENLCQFEMVLKNRKQFTFSKSRSLLSSYYYLYFYTTTVYILQNLQTYNGTQKCNSEFEFEQTLVGILWSFSVGGP